jgi:hypothetical protein
MWRQFVRGVGVGIAIDFHEHKARRVVRLLHDIESRDARFLHAGAGISERGRLESLKVFGLYLDLDLHDEHVRVIGQTRSTRKCRLAENLPSCNLPAERNLMAGKIEIPENLKADLPQNKFGKILGATPIIMTVIATMLAGLASSEMTKAQYDRALAAQLQSKAGDQWGYFQAKKMRSALAHNSLEILETTTDARPLDAAALPGTDAATIVALTKNQLPEATLAKMDDSVTAALTAMARSKPESDVTAALAKVKPQTLADALAAAKDAVNTFDNTIKPITRSVDKLNATLMNGDTRVFRDFTMNRLNYTAARYDAESALNMAVANLYELQVRQGNISAEHHHRRSAKFFYGMLAAQMAVIISTFAIAARKRNFLWSIAAAAGAAAIGFAAYVYLYG